MWTRVLRSPDSAVEEISASDLVNSPPVKKPRPPLPPGFKVQPAYPGATYGWHPVDKLLINLEKAKGLETPGNEPTPPPAPAPEPVPLVTEIPTPAPEPTPIPEPEPTPGPTPDFSDIGGPSNGAGIPGAQAQPQDREQARKSYTAVGSMLHTTISKICASIFGKSFESDEREHSAIVETWVDCLEFWNVRVLNPVERLAMAYGNYFFARSMAVVKWWMDRKKKKDEANTVNVEAEVTQDGPTIVEEAE